MESKLLKYAKYLELGESVIAFHGVLLPLFLFLILTISGCVWFADNRIAVKHEINTNSPQYKEMLSRIIGNRYESEEFLRIAAADLSLAEYNLLKEGEETAIANPK